MSENEVIYRLREHLTAKKKQRGFNNKTDRLYCINYIMDFLFIDVKQAKQFYKKHIEGVQWMDLTELSKEIHENAVEHGWWDEPRSFAEVVALCHSELSEALEEDRQANPIIYVKNGKPEGIATEMIDCLIRILDWCAYAGVDVDALVTQKHEFNKTRPYKHGKKY